MEVVSVVSERPECDSKSYVSHIYTSQVAISFRWLKNFGCNLRLLPTVGWWTEHK